MTTDTLYTGAEVQEKLIAGIRKVANAVGSTMGTGGSNAIIEAIEYPGHLQTNDGFSIANAIRLADPIEEIGRRLLVEAINRANKQSGDGSSTTCVLTAAIIEEGLKHLTESSVMDIKRSLEACIPLIEASIEAQKRIITVDEVGAVATISAEDAEIGARIQEIYQQIGKDGLIYWDISKTAEDSYTVGTGITIEGAGYLSAYMCDASESGQNTNQVRLKDAHLLLTKQKISSANDLAAIGAELNTHQIKDVVVFCDDIDPLVVPDLIKTRMVRGFRFVVVKMPILWRDWWFEDLAKASGATVVDPAAGFPLKNLNKSHLGIVGNIIIDKDDTFVDGIKDLTEHIAALNADPDDNNKLRASRLNVHTARYFVGAHSDSALSYRRLKVEDAIAASWQALNGGIVAGGGVALMNVTDKLPEDIGALILKEALKAPINQIGRNAGLTSELVVPEGYGYDTRTGKVVDMFEANIVDPANIVLNAAKNAISVAATILTATTVVTFPKVDENPLSQRNSVVL
ncbi:MAG: TCP-1/cpn60 chaperonin family protein [Candidatus Paceibacterota bacterium]|jgi:chaperonin GroEL